MTAPTSPPAGWSSRLLPLGLLIGRSNLAKFVRPYLWAVPVVVALGLVASVLEGASIGILVPLVALLLSDELPNGIPEPILWLANQADGLAVESRVLAIGAIVLVLVVVRSAIQVANVWLAAFVASRVGHNLSSALSRRILGAEYAQLMGIDQARLVEIVSSDSREATKVVIWMLEIAIAATALTVFAALLLWLEWRLFLLVAAAAILLTAAIALIELRLRRISIEVTAASWTLASRIQSIISSIKVIHLFGQRGREQDKFDVASQRVSRAFQASDRVYAIMEPTVELIIASLFVAILLVGYRLGISLALMTGFLVLLIRCQPYGRAISALWLRIATVRGSLSEIDWLLSALPAPNRANGAGEPLPRDVPIAFADVSYVYPNGTVGLSRASFELQPGSATALIGRSGSGKSTAVNLLCAMLEPTSGRILIGDHELDRSDRVAWRERLAVAGQDFELVQGTIAENIAYARPDADRAEVEEMAHRAGADAFIRALPLGYDTPVFGTGLNLSGGQRQRIGLARALLRNPDILILDEATNAVDGLSEREIMRLLAEHRNFRTALVISHRPLTLEACDNGIVLAEGTVVESGPLRTLDYFRKMTGSDD